MMWPLRRLLVQVGSVVLMAGASPVGLAAQTASGEAPPPAITLRFQYVGFLGEDHGADSCPAARRSGTITVEAPLAHAGGEPPDDVAYEGEGRVVFDIDDCDLKPTGDGLHDYCTIAIAASFGGHVRFEIDELEDGQPREASLVVEPRGPIAATVDGDCPAALIAELRRRVERGTYWTGQHIGPLDEDTLQKIARGGIPRPGRHAQPADDGRGAWTITIDDGAVCEAERVALEQARTLVAVAAQDAHETFVEASALSQTMVANTAAAPVAAFFRSQQTGLTVAFATRASAAAGAARDAAEAEYSRAVDATAAQLTSQMAQLAVAEAPVAPPDPRTLQLSMLLQRFAARAHSLSTAVASLQRAASAHAQCWSKYAGRGGR